MREEKQHKIEVHVAGICFQEDKVLAVKRTDERRLYPGLWECGGGQVETGENFEDAVKRQLKEELGVIAEPIKLLKTYEIQTSEGKIPGLKFICRIKDFANGKEPKTSKEHTEWKWIPIDKLDEFEFIPGVKEDILNAYEEYRKNTHNFKSN